MKKTIILFGIILMGIINLNAQDCYTVREINNKTENPDLSSKRFTFGIKQMTEEILSEKLDICENGTPVEVEIMSVEAPTNSTSLGPWAKTKKITIVKLRLLIEGEEYWGQGEANVTVQSTFLDLNDDNIPFNKTSFSGAVKKALVEAVGEFK